MQQLTFEQLRPQLKTVLHRVIAEHEPVTIALDHDHEVVVVDADDYLGLLDTLALLRTPANAERMAEGMRQHRSGQRRTIDVTAYLDGNRS